jgi:hypothetical protein
MMDHIDSATTDIVTDQQRAFFDAYGYLILPGLFADDIEQITQAFDEVFADSANPRLELKLVGHRFHTRIAMGDFIEKHPCLASIATDPRLTAAAAGLLDPGAAYYGSDGSIYACETEWHYDTPTQQKDRRHIKCAFYLEPLDGDTGAPRVLPLSHHDVSLYAGVLEPYLGFDGTIEDRTGLRGEDLPSWALPSVPGDLLIWDFRVMHCSYGSTAARRQVALNFCGGRSETSPTGSRDQVLPRVANPPTFVRGDNARRD